MVAVVWLFSSAWATISKFEFEIEKKSNLKLNLEFQFHKVNKEQNRNKAKRFPKQQRSNVDIALASDYCYCLHSELTGWPTTSCYSGELLTALDRCKKSLLLKKGYSKHQSQHSIAENVKYNQLLANFFPGCIFTFKCILISF